MVISPITLCGIVEVEKMKVRKTSKNDFFFIALKLKPAVVINQSMLEHSNWLFSNDSS